MAILEDYETFPASDLPLLIVPHQNPLMLKVGDKLIVQVLYKGEPVADAPIVGDYVNDAGAISKTDAQGLATIVVRNNALNIIATQVEHKTPNDPDGDLIQHRATLSFTLGKHVKD